MIDNDDSYNPPRSETAKGISNTKVDTDTNTGKTQEELDAEAAADAGGKTAEELEEEARIAAEGNGKTPEELEAEKLLAEAEAEKTAAQIIAEAALEKKLLDGILAKAGVKTLDELMALKKPVVAETPEEIKAKEENEKAAIIQYGVKYGKITTDEIFALENLKKRPAAEVVYDDFSTEYKDKYKGRLNDDDTPNPVTEDEVKEAFDDFYHLNSDNKVTKAKGESLIEKRGKELIADLDKKYSDTVADYHYILDRNTFMKDTFIPLIKGAMNDLPKELTFGEGDKKVVIQTEGFNKDTIEEKVATNAVFDELFKAKGEQKAQDAIKQQIKNELIAQNIDKIVAMATSVAYGQGLEKGKIGGKAPFVPPGPKGNNGAVVTKGKISAESETKLKSAYGDD